MAHGAPDWVRTVAVTVVVPSYPGTAAGDVGQYAGAATTYQVLASWTVSASHTGSLQEVSMHSNNYAKTVWKLEIASTTFFDGLTIGAALTLPFNGPQLAEGTEVILSAKSSDGTIITADGSIVAQEVG